jgi:hypothetical protein
MCSLRSPSASLALAEQVLGVGVVIDAGWRSRRGPTPPVAVALPGRSHEPLQTFMSAAVGVVAVEVRRRGRCRASRAQRSSVNSGRPSGLTGGVPWRSRCRRSRRRCRRRCRRRRRRSRSCRAGAACGASTASFRRGSTADRRFVDGAGRRRAGRSSATVVVVADHTREGEARGSGSTAKRDLEGHSLHVGASVSRRGQLRAARTPWAVAQTVTSGLWLQSQSSQSMKPSPSLSTPSSQRASASASSEREALLAGLAHLDRLSARRRSRRSR